MRQTLILPFLWILTSIACQLTSTPTLPAVSETAVLTGTALLPIPDTVTPPVPSVTSTVSVTPTNTSTETPAPTETASPIPSDTALPTVESLNAKVTANRLSCRYGPGPDYLYLFALRATANIKLIGRVEGENWNWALVENKVPCWVKADFLTVEGDVRNLPVVYPGVAKLPITPYYPPSEVTSATRNNLTNEVTVSWVEIPISLGDYEGDNMQTYIAEIWRCQGGQLIFDPLATRIPYVTFLDEPGCSQPSHGQVWVQEKHGYAGPAEIPWPEYP
jgi:hypothetical protein